jgi:hypothetical protein
MALVDNLPADLSTRPGMQYVLGQLLGDKRPPFPTEEAITKSMLMLQESMFLTTKMVLARAKSVRVALWGVEEATAFTYDCHAVEPCRLACRWRRGGCQLRYRTGRSNTLLSRCTSALTSALLTLSWAARPLKMPLRAASTPFDSSWTSTLRCVRIRGCGPTL